MGTRSFLGGVILFLTLLSCNKGNSNLKELEKTAQKDVAVDETVKTNTLDSKV
jgi:hypothetical protein